MSQMSNTKCKTRFVPWQTVTNLLERKPLSLIFLGGGISVASIFFRSGMLNVESGDVGVPFFRDEYRVRDWIGGAAARFVARHTADGVAIPRASHLACGA
jgi:hypothetical protein